MDFEKEMLKKTDEKNDGEISKRTVFKEASDYLDIELGKKDINIEKITDFLLELKRSFVEKEMKEEFELICAIYLLNEKYMTKLVNSNNVDFLFLLRKFYAKSGFFEFYLIVLKKMKDIIVKSNLLELLGKEFLDLDFQIKNYVEYLKDSNEYLELYEEKILEYNIFREVLQPFIDDIIYNNKVEKMVKLLEIFEKMSLSPDKYVKVLLIDTVIEGGWLEKENLLEKYMKNFGDNFLTFYAVVYDGRIFFKNERIWKEVEKRKLTV